MRRSLNHRRGGEGVFSELRGRPTFRPGPQNNDAREKNGVPEQKGLHEKVLELARLQTSKVTSFVSSDGPFNELRAQSRTV